MVGQIARTLLLSAQSGNRTGPERDQKTQGSDPPESGKLVVLHLTPPCEGVVHMLPNRLAASRLFGTLKTMSVTPWKSSDVKRTTDRVGKPIWVFTGREK